MVDLYEEGSTGVFTSKSMLLMSNDGDDDYEVDSIADDALNDRTRKIMLDGKLKVELLVHNPTPTYKAVLVSIKKTVKIKRWIAKIGGIPVVTRSECR